ncbi:NAD(P)/FAD-dependent oxidoreductase [Jatrophihabitans sp.]|uniref:NAD(P)/FAD-dependent oxidoreductase n=1 Tax=Jatrophihabitans sp. TaxID=1932789 RepID=UPI002F25D2B3
MSEHDMPDSRPSTTAPAGPRPEIDVIVLGSGLAGSAMAAVLAEGGAEVLILDAGSHPRFAIGESTIPYTSMLMRLVAERYNIPELKHLTTFENVQERISSSSGIKRNFGFLYHREGQPQRFDECHEFPIPKITHTENHFFRQDIDSWMLQVAAKHGANIRQNVRITDIDVDQAGATVTDSTGKQWRARYVIDASGFRSPIATKFGLREEPTRLRHHSRSMFTHMVDVTPYEDTVPPGAHGNPTNWSQGTLHHLFEGGWAWVIPFNNHARATNSLVSVGLNLDPRIHPKPDCTPTEEFQSFIDRFPDIRAQFAKAKPVRDWVSTGRLQYSSKQTVGYRWCMTSHAAGFVDALFSRGLSNTFEIINALGFRLLDALRDDDFDPARFEYVQHLEQSQLDFNDDLVANAYTSFGDYDLWDAWFRVWSAGQVLATFEINRAYATFLDSHDTRDLLHLEKLAPNGSIPDYEPARQLLRNVSEQCKGVSVGSIDSQAAARAIMAELTAADFIPPAFGLANPDNRWFNATFPKVLKTLKWAKTEAPAPIGELVYDGLTLFIKKRLSRDEFNLGAEVKHWAAEQPVIGRRLRVPVPR